MRMVSAIYSTCDPSAAKQSLSIALGMELEYFV